AATTLTPTPHSAATLREAASARSDGSGLLGDLHTVGDSVPSGAVLLLDTLHGSGFRGFPGLPAGDVDGLDRNLVRMPIGVGLVLLKTHLQRLLHRRAFALQVGQLDDADQLVVAVDHRQ